MKKDLMKLNLIPQEKLFIWLLSKGFKKGTEIEYKPSFFDFLNKKLFNKKNKLELFFEKHGFKYKKHSNTKSRKYLHYAVSLDEKLVEELLNIYSINQSDTNYKHSTRLGTIFGYPKEAVKEFTNILKMKPKQKYYWDTHKKFKAETKGLYWQSYIIYRPREKYVYKDSLLAKKWADVTKKEFPELDKQMAKIKI